MKKAGFLICGVLFAGLSAGRADFPDDARIDLIGDKEQVEIEVNGASPGAKAVHAEWRGDMAPYQINATFPASDKWEEGFIKFVPKKSGLVVISLAGPHLKKGSSEAPQVWVGYDDIRAEGAQLKNGSFEQVDPGGAVSGWYRPGGAAQNESRFEQKDAADGKTFAVVWHNARIQQSIQVEEGKPVTLTFKMRLVHDE